MNRQHLLSRLAARGWPIAYSTGALDIWQRGTRSWEEAPWRGRSLRDHGVLVDIPGRALPRWQTHPVWDRLTLRLHATRLRRALGIRHGNGIALLFHPMFSDYVEPLRLRYLALHVYDNYALQPGWSPQHAEQFNTLTARADLITCSAPTMVESLLAPGGPQARVLPNGADIAAFAAGARAPCPPDLMPIPRPRIHYAGTLNCKVDFNLVSAIASRRPDWHWVLVGQLEEAEVLADALIREGLRACRTLPNVHFLGLKDSRAVPPYVAHSDVNVMCYRTHGGWWQDIYPLKLHEYLAAGRPVVSSDLPTIRPFSNVVALAIGLDGWLQALEQAIAGTAPGSAASRFEVAAANSWDERADRLDEWLRELHTRGGAIHQ
jgi:glycosyltransferase involved in cell wall biosynthesis